MKSSYKVCKANEELVPKENIKETHGFPSSSLSPFFLFKEGIDHFEQAVFNIVPIIKIKGGSLI